MRPSDIEVRPVDHGAPNALEVEEMSASVGGLGGDPTAVLEMAMSTVLGLDETTTIFFAGLASAALGTVVAWTAYRGYTRNDSRPMLFLAVGVAFLTVVPFALSHAFDQATDATDASVLLVVTVCHLLGLLAIVRSFRRPDST